MNMELLFAGLGMWEIILIVFVLLLFFGAKRLPDLMKSIGKGVRSFKEGMSNIEKEVNSNIAANEKKDDKTEDKAE